MKYQKESDVSRGNKALSAKWGNSIGIASSLAAVLGFLVNDSLGARASAGQDHSSYLYIILLIVADVVAIAKSRVTPIATLSLLSIIALLIYTLVSSSIRITF